MSHGCARAPYCDLDAMKVFTSYHTCTHTLFGVKMGISIFFAHTRCKSIMCVCVCFVVSQTNKQNSRLLTETPSLLPDYFTKNVSVVLVFSEQEGRAETPPRARGKRSGARGRSWLDLATANGSMCAWDLDLYR